MSGGMCDGAPEKCVEIHSHLNLASEVDQREAREQGGRRAQECGALPHHAGPRPERECGPRAHTLQLDGALLGASHVVTVACWPSTPDTSLHCSETLSHTYTHTHTRCVEFTTKRCSHKQVGSVKQAGSKIPHPLSDKEATRVPSRLAPQGTPQGIPHTPCPHLKQGHQRIRGGRPERPVEHEPTSGGGGGGRRRRRRQ